MSAELNNDIVIKVEHLSKSFNDIPVLSDINLYLKRTENLAILGRSGVGKSVLLKCIVGLVIPEKGEVTVLNELITNTDEDKLNEIRKHIGYVFQSAALYDSMTIRENLLFTIEHNNTKIEEDNYENYIKETLESVGLKDILDMYPLELSGGMRKRAGLARTLVRKPEIILYDEPTTGLDPFTSREISELILEIKKKYNTSAIIVTHDMTCAKITSDRVMILHDGTFIAEDTFNNLKKNQVKEVREYFLT